MKKALFAILLVFAQFCFAASLELLEPLTTASDGGLVEYGSVGPGQTFTVQISPLVYSQDGEFLGQWDSSYATHLPDGWASERSKLYDNPLVLKVTVDPNAKEGDYYISIKTVDELGQEEIGDAVEFALLVHVRHDVLGMSVEPKELETGAGQPARFTITLLNNGSAKDVFSVNARGVKGWEFEKKIYLPPASSKTFVYEVTGNDESSYRVTFTAESDSSPIIYDSAQVGLDVKTNLASDYIATSNGVLLFPILQVPIYSVVGIISLLFG